MTTAGKGHLFVISSVSGGGKTTIINRLLAADPKLVLSVSHTTRKPRGEETDGVEYHFVSVEEFERLVEKGAFLEWARVYDNFYGTAKKAVEKELNRGADVLLDIDVQGAGQVKEIMPEAISIFIVPPTLEELERRLRNRGTDSWEAIAKRLEAVHRELANATQYDYSVRNDDLDAAVSEVSGIIDKARLTETPE